jgi:hypothetical protein
MCKSGPAMGVITFFSRFEEIELKSSVFLSWIAESASVSSEYETGKDDMSNLDTVEGVSSINTSELLIH